MMSLKKVEDEQHPRTHIMTQTNELGQPGHKSDVAPTKVLQPQTHRKKDENDGPRTEKREQKGSERMGGGRD
jgi:hypothetical protein